MDDNNNSASSASPFSLEALRALDAIQRKGSFSAAANELYKVPSALSYTIHKLEQSLGVSLFNRSGHRAELTPAGKLVWEQGQKILKAAEELTIAARRVAKGWETRLRIAVDCVIPHAFMFPLINEFQKTNIGVEIQLMEEVLGGTLDALLCDRADLAIGTSHLPSASDYHARLAGYVDFEFVAPANHPLIEKAQPLLPDDIKQYTAIVAADSSRHSTPLNSGLLDGQTRITVHNLEAKLQAHLAGLGVGFLPKHIAAPYIANKQLISLTVAQPKPTTPIYFVWRKTNQGKALEWFLQRTAETKLVEHILQNY